MKTALVKHLGFAIVLSLASVGSRADELLVKIGHAGPLSGSQAKSGKDNERGVQLAVAELNAANFMIGGKRAKFELLSEDDQGDPKQGVSAAQKLIDADVKAVIGHYNSGVSIPASRIYNEAGIPMVTGASSNPQLTKLGYKYVFRLAANDGVMGARVAQLAAEKLKLKRIAVIDDRTSYGSGVADVFIANARKLNMQVTAREYTTDKATDFMAILTKAKSTNPDAVFFGGYYPQGGAMARQMKQLGMEIPLLGGDGLCAADIVKISAGAVEDKLYCAQGGAPLISLPEGAAFRARFQKAFGEDVDVYAPAFYVATLVVADAMRRANSPEPKDFVPVLASGTFTSILGGVKFGPTGEWEGALSTVYKISDGKLTPVSR